MKKFILLVLLVPFFVFASNDRSLYVKKYSKESKVALVIGNSNYDHFSILKNSLNDAKDMKNTLESKGFKVHYLENASLRQMKKIMRNFSDDLKNGGVGMVYYAGHGIEVDGSNYLIPVDANIPAKDEVEYEAFAVNMLIDKMENAGNRLNILVLDACRNDPFSRGSGGGLAAINNAKGMFVAYATAPGEVASDGSGSNGLFTKHLLKQIKKDQKLEDVFKNTRTLVYNESNGKQLPWSSSSVMGEFYFTIDKVNTQDKRETYPKQEESSFSFSTQQPDFYALKIQTIPYDAKVKITNIQSAYYDGIKLSKGKYDIEVTHQEYYPKVGSIDLKSDLSLKIELEKKQLVQPKVIYTPKEVQTYVENKYVNNKSDKQIYNKYKSGQLVYSSDDSLIKAPDIGENGAVIPVSLDPRNQKISKIYFFTDANDNADLATFTTLDRNSLKELGIRIKMQNSGNVYAISEKFDGSYIVSKKFVKLTKTANIHDASNSKMGKMRIKAKERNDTVEVKLMAKIPMSPTSYMSKLIYKDKNTNKALVQVDTTMYLSKNPYFKLKLQGIHKGNELLVEAYDNHNKQYDFTAKIK